MSIINEFYNYIEGKNITNLELLGKYEFKNSEYDIIFWIFEINWIFSKDCYFFVYWWDFQTHTFNPNSIFSFPYIIIKDNDINNISKKLSQIINKVWEKYIPQTIYNLDQINSIFNNNSQIICKKISWHYLIPHDMNNIFSFSYLEPKINIIYKETWIEEELYISDFVKQYCD